MEYIDNVTVLKDYVENKGFIIRDKVEGIAFDALYFNLIGEKQFFKCYTDDSSVIDYIYLIS